MDRCEPMCALKHGVVYRCLPREKPCYKCFLVYGINIVLFLYIFSLIFGITNAPGMPPGHNTLPWWVSSWAFMELGDRVQPEWESEQSVQPVHSGILYCRQRLDHWYVWNQLHHKSSQKCNGGGRTVAVGFTLLFPLATSFILTL